MATAVDAAVAAFRTSLLERGALVGAPEAEAAEAGRRAALLVGSASAWREHLGKLLDLRQTMDLLGVGTRQAVYDLVTRRRLLGLPRHGGGMVFPAFQFDATTGRPYTVLHELLASFAAAGTDPYTVATWLATGQDELKGGCPVSLLDDPSAAGVLKAAAERTAARLSH